MINQSYISRAYTTKRLSQVRANVGKNHYVTTAISIPSGTYNMFALGIFSITDGYELDSIIGPSFHVTFSVGGDNPLFTPIPNRNWESSHKFKKNGNYQCIGGSEIILINSMNTIEVRTGLRDDASPVIPGDGYDDTTVFVFQVMLRLTLKIAKSTFVLPN